MFEFFSPKRKVLVAVLVLVTLVGAFVFNISFVKPAEAQGTAAKAVKTVAGAAAVGGLIWAGITVSGAVADLVRNFDTLLIGTMKYIANLLGQLFVWVTGMLVKVAAYNSFLDATAVVTGWVIVRDLANMFFILILLVISIATILRVEAYSYKKLLPKLLLMAVLINFSKTICGIIIDFSQVIMLTFVNAFQAAAGANFWQAFGIEKMYSFSNLANNAEAAGQQWSMVGSALLALIVILVATVTVGVLLIVLVARIVVLWTLIVLSPLAYLLASFPQGQQYAKQWWEEFSKNVISGPILAFFIWLSLIVAGGGAANVEVGAQFTAEDIPAGMSDAADPNNLSTLVVSVTLLLVGLMFTQKLSVVGSGAAEGVLNYAKKKPMEWAKGARKWGREKAGAAWSRGTGAISEYTYAKTGVALPFSEQRKEARDKRRNNISAMREAEGMAKSAERMAGGRAFLASVVDPRAASKIGRWEMAQATFGGKEARAKVQRAADSLTGAAVSEMRSVDPLQAERLKQRTEAAIGEQQAAGQIKERDALELKVRRGQADVFQLERGIQGVATTRQRQSMSDTDLKKDLARERAENQVAEEEKKTPMTETERRERYKELYDKNLSEIDVGKERKRIDSFLKGGDKSQASKIEAQFIFEKGKLEDALKVDASDLEKVKLRLESPSQARGDALSRRQDAGKKIGLLNEAKAKYQPELDKLIEKESGPAGFLTPEERDKKFDLETKQKGIDVQIQKWQNVVQNVDVELKAIEQAAGADKVKSANEFFGKSYKEQLEQATRSAEGHSEANLAKALAAALKSNKITRDEFNKIAKQWGEENVSTAKASLDKFLKDKAGAAGGGTP